MRLGRRPPATREERLAAVGFDLGGLRLEEVAACDLCAGERFVQIARRDRYGIPLRTRLCEGCGLVFLSPRPDPASYAELYARWYRPLVSAYSGREKTATSLAAQQEAYAASLDEHLLRPFLRDRPRGGLLLDLGGSTGAVADFFVRRYGFQGVVVDPSPEEAAVASGRGLETFVGLAEDFDPGPRRFDLVLLCQTIDHLLSPARVLAKARQWIRDDGLFVVDPVDFRAVMRKHHSLSEPLKIDHPYYLTRETADLYLARAGFEPLRIDASGNVLHLDYVCRPATPREAAASPAFARELLAEIRWIQATHTLGRAPGGAPSRRQLLARLLRLSFR